MITRDEGVKDLLVSALKTGTNYPSFSLFFYSSNISLSHNTEPERERERGLITIKKTHLHRYTHAYTTHRKRIRILKCLLDEKKGKKTKEEKKNKKVDMRFFSSSTIGFFYWNDWFLLTFERVRHLSNEKFHFLFKNWNRYWILKMFLAEFLSMRAKTSSDDD